MSAFHDDVNKKVLEALTRGENQDVRNVLLRETLNEIHTLRMFLIWIMVLVPVGLFIAFLVIFAFYSTANYGTGY